MQNDRETWYMIDSSFITTLPDTWGIGERFLLLPINKWNEEYHKVWTRASEPSLSDSRSAAHRVQSESCNDSGRLVCGSMHSPIQEWSDLG